MLQLIQIQLLVLKLLVLKVLVLKLLVLVLSWVSDIAPFAATTFNLTRGGSFWNADTRITQNASSRHSSMEIAAQCAERKSKSRRHIMLR